MLKFELGWQCDAAHDSFKRFNSSQAITKIRWGDGTTGRWATISWPITKTPKDYFYAILGKALETGDLTRLKICRHCGKYLVAVKDRKRDFCEGTSCKGDFHDSERRRVGYYKDRRRKLRTQAIKHADQLLAEGRAQKIPRQILLEQIEEKTKLPQRVVEQRFDKPLHTKPTAPTIPQSSAVPSPAEVARLRRLLAEERRRAAAYVKKTKTVECPQCHRRRTVPIGVKAHCDHTDRAGATPSPIKTR